MGRDSNTDRFWNAESLEMTSLSLMAELEVAVKNGSPEKRVETLRRITSLFLDESDRFNEPQVGVFDDVMVHLMERIEAKALAQLSSDLAPVDNAPLEVVRRLSRHDEVTIAGPVLAQSKRLSEQDLLEVAKSKGKDHLLAMSGRTSLSEAVTDVLVERGDTKVHHSLAVNSGARFSETGFATLVMKSDGDEHLAERLGSRLDIPSQMLEQLLVRATDAVRSRLLKYAPPENRGRIQLALAHVADEVGREAAAPLRDFRRAESDVAELNKHGKLTEALFIEFVTAGRFEHMAATLALFCGTTSTLIERIFQNVRREGIIVACKAGKLKWPTVRLLLQAEFSRHTLTEAELRDTKDAFLALSQDSAQRSMRFMQVHDATKKAS
jgi:uncharacterized protein (DUF2336 family)